ncbi:hypothetical protein PPL_04440 [Heterostelium album PN500]|uniref:Ankyrin repeat protein n=1 Tax=Heterostelium pallidum (strain ATCC 26659 / Pp 5 / PN500) TaxID=670386 RepID=D3B7K2_HETP5|nr:hypothetical protein PPL_04440 [Heterostelium album PN500]EFA82745.1 hypothetical protein PPL_04440 [Heterostelium album PN500]|eukprot:XP_020434862.1 hypothetical protein PPL_04440 [Heterostelium album PN500]
MKKELISIKWCNLKRYPDSLVSYCYFDELAKLLESGDVATLPKLTDVLQHLPTLKILDRLMEVKAWPNNLLQLAIENQCSFETIQFLVENRRDQQDIVSAIISATEHSNLDTIIYLMSKLPDSLSISNFAGKFNPPIVAARGDIGIIRYLESVDPNIDWLKSIEHVACRNHLEMVRFLLDLIPFDSIVTLKTVEAVAKYGDLELLILLFARNQSQINSFKTMDMASKHNRLEIVKWIHENRTEGCSKAAVIYASANRNIELVKWLHENRTEGCYRSAINNASANGDLELVEWIHKNRTEGCSGRAVNQASLNGHLSVVQFLCENYIDNIKDQILDALIYAASKGNLDIVKYLLFHPLTVANQSINRVFNSDYPEIIDFLFKERKIHYNIKPSKLYNIIANGCVHSFKTIHQLGLSEINGNHFSIATLKNQLEIVEYIHQHIGDKIRYSISTLEKSMIKNHPAITRYLVNNNLYDINYQSSIQTLISFCSNNVTEYLDILELMLIKTRSIVALDIHSVLRGGNIYMLKILMNYQDKYTDKTYSSTWRSEAIMYQFVNSSMHFETLRYLVEDLQIAPSTTISWKLPTLETIEYLYEKCREVIPKDICYHYARTGELDVIKFFHEETIKIVTQKNGIIEFDISKLFDKALEYGRLNIMNYLDTYQKSKVCSQSSFEEAKKKKYTLALNYIIINNYKDQFGNILK